MRQLMAVNEYMRGLFHKLDNLHFSPILTEKVYAIVL